MSKLKQNFLVMFAFLVGWGLPVQAMAQDKDIARKGDPLITQLSSDYIDVSAGFGGATIELFGDRSDADTEVAVVVEGPRREITIWKKARVMGAWVNRYFVSFQSIPVYYNYAISDVDFISNNNDFSVLHNVGTQSIFKEDKIEKSGSVEDVSVFTEELIKKRMRTGVFPEKPAKIEFLSPHFFRVSFKIPQSVPTGEYKIHTYLLKEGEVIDRAVQALSVKQVGLNAYVLRVAREHSFLYSLGCILFALLSGWFVSALRVKV